MMADIDMNDADPVATARHNARLQGHVQNVQMMLVAAGMAAFGIVAVATAMLTTVL